VVHDDALTPWNYPMMMAVWKFAPAIAAGNTVVLKPAHTTPASTIFLAEVASEFFSSCVLNILCSHNREMGAARLGSPISRKVSITGSVRAGREVARAATGDIKRVHLELGGKAPVVVFDDADVQTTTKGIALAGYSDAGRDCTAPTRVLAGAGIHDNLAASAAGRRLPDGPDTPGADLWPLNSAAQLERVSSYIERPPDYAEDRTWGRPGGDGGFFREPTVVTGIAQDDEIIQEELFGPVISVQSFAEEKEAVERAHDIEFGLASSVWTKGHARAMRVWARLDFGCVWINTHIPLVAEMPLGGFKAFGPRDYTRVKHVTSSVSAT
jgi:betaine-aldehyde dehydrogenase